MATKIQAKVHIICNTATAEAFYDAWLSPDKARLWMGAALREAGLAGDIRAVEIDARVGGRFLFSDQRGDVEARHWGSYRELVPGRRIVFTWIVDAEEEADPSVVTLELSSAGAGCEIRLTHEMDAAWADYVERTELGWSRMLRACASVVGEVEETRS